MDVEKFVEDELKKLEITKKLEELDQAAEKAGLDEPHAKLSYKRSMLQAQSEEPIGMCTYYGGTDPMTEYDCMMYGGSWEAPSSGGDYYYYDDPDCECDDVWNTFDGDCNVDNNCDPTGNETGHHEQFPVGGHSNSMWCGGFNNNYPYALLLGREPVCDNPYLIRVSFSTGSDIPANAIIDKAIFTFHAAAESDWYTGHNVYLDQEVGSGSIASVCEGSDGIQEFGNNQVPIGFNRINWTIPVMVAEQEYKTPNIACAVQDAIEMEIYESDNGIYLMLMPFASSHLATFYSLRLLDFTNATLDVWWHSTMDEEGNGGTVAGGVSEVFVVSNETSEGGVVVNGESYLAPILEVEMSGGIVVGGEADLPDPEDIIDLEMTGGVVVNGEAWIGGTIIPTGGVVVGQGTYPNGYKYRLPFVIPPGAVKNDLERFYPIIVANVHSHLVETGTDFHVEDDQGNTVLHSIRSYHNGKLVFSIKTPLTTSGKNFHLYYGRN